jgi:Rieske 2Fe-2S family protein
MTTLPQDLARTQREFAMAETLPGAVYGSREVFERERATIFARDWICLGHTSEVAAAGDFVLRELAGESVIVVRGEDAGVRAFFNVCRHRGSRLLDSASGRGLTRILCPYHAWGYQLDGRLHAAPMMRGDFRREDHGLVPVRLESFHGFLFATLDANAAPLARWLQDMPDLARYRMADLKLGRRVEYDVQANWKLICENYSECYHCPGAHPQLHKLTELIQRDERPMEIGRCFNGGPMRLRDGIETMSGSGVRRLPLIPGLTMDDARYVHYYVVYPNLLLSPHPDYVLAHTLWPLAPDRTRVVCEWLVTREAAADQLIDVVDFWDLTNKQDWALCERAQAGVVSRGYRQGPYAAAEDCVHTFDRWYADRLASAL